MGFAEEIVSPQSPPPAASKRKQLQSNAMKRTSEWSASSLLHPLLHLCHVYLLNTYLGFFYLLSWA